MSNYSGYAATHQQPPLYYPSQNGFTPPIFYDNSPIMYGMASSPSMPNGVLHDYAGPPVSHGGNYGSGSIPNGGHSHHGGNGNNQHRQNKHSKSSDHYGNNNHYRSKYHRHHNNNPHNSTNNNNSNAHGYQYHQGHQLTYRPFYPSQPPADFGSPQGLQSLPMHHPSHIHHPPPFIPGADPSDAEALLDLTPHHPALPPLTSPPPPLSALGAPPPHTLPHLHIPTHPRHPPPPHPPPHHHLHSTAHHSPTPGVTPSPKKKPVVLSDPNSSEFGEKSGNGSSTSISSNNSTGNNANKINDKVSVDNNSSSSSSSNDSRSSSSNASATTATTASSSPKSKPSASKSQTEREEFVHCGGQITKVWFSAPNEPFPKRRAYYRRLEKLKKEREEAKRRKEEEAKKQAEKDTTSLDTEERVLSPAPTINSASASTSVKPSTPLPKSPVALSPVPVIIPAAPAISLAAETTTTEASPVAGSRTGTPAVAAATPTVSKGISWAERLQQDNHADNLPVSPRKAYVNGTNGSTSNSITSSSNGSSIPAVHEKKTIKVANQKEPLGVVLHNYDYKKVKNLAVPRIYSRGIINTGNICFMNSILQALVHCLPFYQLLEYIASNSVFSIKSETPLMDALINLTRECAEKPKDSSKSINSQPLSPEAFYNTVRAHPRFVHYKRGRQEDAEEFLGYLLEALHDEFVGVMNATALKKEEEEAEEKKGAEEEGWQEVGKNNKSMSVQQNKGFGESPVTRLFGGQLKSTLTASNLKTPSITRDPFQQIQLDISDEQVRSIEDAFVNLAQPEQLQYSTSTKQEVRATKQIVIDEVPEVLIVHLKRFSYTNDGDDLSGGAGGGALGSNGYVGAGGSGLQVPFAVENVQKISKPVTFPEQLRLPREAVGSGALPPPTYTLSAVVYHHGPSAAAGHYTVDVKSVSGEGSEAREEWVNIDDVTLTKGVAAAGGGGVEVGSGTKTAYILFYRRESGGHQ